MKSCPKCKHQRHYGQSCRCGCGFGRALMPGAQDVLKQAVKRTEWKSDIDRLIEQEQRRARPECSCPATPPHGFDKNDCPVHPEWRDPSPKRTFASNAEKRRFESFTPKDDPADPRSLTGDAEANLMRTLMKKGKNR